MSDQPAKAVKAGPELAGESGEAPWRRAVRAAMAAGDQNRVAALFGQAGVDAALALIIRAVQRGKPDEAGRLARQACEVWPSSPAAWAVSARVAHITGDFDTANTCWQACLDRTDFAWPGMRQALLDAARFLMKAGRPDIAFAALDSLLGEAPGDVDVLLLKASLAGTAGLYTLLRATLDRALEVASLSAKDRARVLKLYRFYLGRAPGEDPGGGQGGDPGFMRWLQDEQGPEHYLHRHGESRALLVYFPGMVNQGGGLPLHQLHAILGTLPTHVLYLRDRRRLMHLAGLETLADGFGATRDALRAIRAELDAERLICVGASAGGYAALRYGLELGADHVLGFGAPTTGDEAVLGPERRARLLIARLRRFVPEQMQDVRALLMKHPAPPRVGLYYGTAMPTDRRHAERLAGLPTVRLYPQPDTARHDVMAVLAEQGRLAAVFREVLAA